MSLALVSGARSAAGKPDKMPSWAGPGETHFLLTALLCFPFSGRKFFSFAEVCVWMESLKAII